VIASFSDYLVQIQRLMDGDDVSASEITTETLRQVINLAERKIYRDVRSRFNERAFSGVEVTGNLAALPADFEAVSIAHFGAEALQPIAEEAMREYLQHSPTGECRFFCSAGSSLQFGPAVADGTALQGRYYCRLADLTPANFSTNTLIAREPDLFIYAALVEAVPFYVAAARNAQTYMQKYEQIKDAVNFDSKRVAGNAGRVQRSNSMRLVG
jgi:hypothetical protein